MIGVFCFSEDPAFNGIADRIHVFPDEQTALEWQIDQLVSRGLIFRDGERTWQIEDGERFSSSMLEALSRWQDTCGALEFFHTYPIQSHIPARQQ